MTFALIVVLVAITVPVLFILTRTRAAALWHVIFVGAMLIFIHWSRSTIEPASTHTRQLETFLTLQENKAWQPRAYPTGFHKYSGHALLFLPCEEKVVADYCQRIDRGFASRLAETDTAPQTTSIGVLGTRVVALAGAYALCTKGQPPVAVVPSDSGLFPNTENDSDLLQMVQSKILIYAYRRHMDPQEFSVAWWSGAGKWPDVAFDLPYSGESLMCRASKGIEMRRAVETRDVLINKVRSGDEDTDLSQIISAQIFIVVWPDPQLPCSSEELFKYLQNTPVVRKISLTINNTCFSFDLDETKRYRDKNGFVYYEATFPEPVD